MDKNQEKNFEDIISAAWLQTIEETGIDPDSIFRKRFFALFDNELRWQGLLPPCSDPYCRTDHKVRINKKYLMFEPSHK